MCIQYCHNLIKSVAYNLLLISSHLYLMAQSSSITSDPFTLDKMLSNCIVVLPYLQTLQNFVYCLYVNITIHNVHKGTHYTIPFHFLGGQEIMDCNYCADGYKIIEIFDWLLHSNNCNFWQQDCEVLLITVITFSLSLEMRKKHRQTMDNVVLMFHLWVTTILFSKCLHCIWQNVSTLPYDICFSLHHHNCKNDARLRSSVVITLKL